MADGRSDVDNFSFPLYEIGRREEVAAGTVVVEVEVGSRVPAPAPVVVVVVMVVMMVVAVEEWDMKKERVVPRDERTGRGSRCEVKGTGDRVQLATD